GRGKIWRSAASARSRAGPARSRQAASAKIDARTSAAVAEHDEGGVVVAAPLELVESFGRGEGGACRLLDDDQRGRREPAAGAGRGQRRFGQAAAVGRIEKGERERLAPMRRAPLPFNRP